jgi:hypothetical protein
MMSRSCMVLVAVTSALLGLQGCGGSSSKNCGYYFQVTVTPQSATLDHMAANPDNQIQFVGVGRATAPEGCPSWLPCPSFLLTSLYGLSSVHESRLSTGISTKAAQRLYLFLKGDQLILIVAHVQGPHVLDLV